jgi:hypothetical protein
VDAQPINIADGGTNNATGNEPSTFSLQVGEVVEINGSQMNHESGGNANPPALMVTLQGTHYITVEWGAWDGYTTPSLTMVATQMA